MFQTWRLEHLRLANFTCFKEWYHGFGNPRIEVFSWEIPTKGLSIATFTERSPSQIYNAWIFGAQSLGITCGYWQFSGSTRRFQGVQSQEAVSQWEEAPNWSMGEMGASKRRSGRVKSKIMPVGPRPIYSAILVVPFWNLTCAKEKLCCLPQNPVAFVLFPVKGSQGEQVLQGEEGKKGWGLNHQKWWFHPVNSGNVGKEMRRLDLIPGTFQFCLFFQFFRHKAPPNLPSEEGTHVAKVWKRTSFLELPGLRLYHLRLGKTLTMSGDIGNTPRLVIGNLKKHRFHMFQRSVDLARCFAMFFGRFAHLILIHQELVQLPAMKKISPSPKDMLGGEWFLFLPKRCEIYPLVI